MPKLISAIKKDLSAEKQQHIREFLVLPHQKVYHQMPLHWRFVYFENEFADLKVKLNILLNMDYIEKVSAERTPIYRMKEDFVELIKRCGSQVRIG